MILVGDCLDYLPMLDANSVDSCVTDPPYGLTANKKGGTGVASVNLESPYGRARIGTGNGPGGFMGMAWDRDVPSVEIWREVYRVLKPGAFLLAFFGTRTYHRGVVAIEDAGFEIRDQVQWVFGSGFPKSHDVSKGVDKHLGVEPKLTDRPKPGHESFVGRGESSVQSFKGTMGGDGGFSRPWMDDPEAVARYHMQSEPGSEQARDWAGWGTALKPAHEPIVVARKPLTGTVAQNVLEWGVGGLNIDGCRVGDGADKIGGGCAGDTALHGGGIVVRAAVDHSVGRWPANLIHDGSDEVLAAFPDAKGQAGADGARHGAKSSVNTYGDYGPRQEFTPRLEIEKSAARFFYCAKTSKSDRNDGLDRFLEAPSAASEFRPNHTEKAAAGEGGNPYGRWAALKNNHPTVKPTDLMRYLCRLVTPPGGTVLDPFAGSGSTGRGAALEGFEFIGIEMDPGYAAIAEARIAAAERTALSEVYA